MIRPPQHRINQQGFTLVELAVVIAIIGLLVGGVTAGQYLLKQGELQSAINDISKYKTAYGQFKEQYKGPPGDIADATDYWGTDTTGTCPAGSTAFKKETCNGDNNGALDLANSPAEIFRAWQQLADAGMIEGTFTGVTGGTGGSTVDAQPGTNVPAGKRASTGYTLFWLPSISTNAFDQYNGDYGNILMFGAAQSGTITKGAALSPREAAQIDTKMDDGAPGTGKIFTNRTTSANCVSDQSNSANVTAAYLVAKNSVACALGLKLDQ